MLKTIDKIRQSLVFKLILTVGLTLLISIATWAVFIVKYQQNRLKEEITTSAERLSDTIMLGTHYSMMLNSRDDINQIINNIAKRKDIENIRIYNKEGQIKFSNDPDEVDEVTNIKAEACDICHRTDPPMVNVNLKQRTRILTSPEGYREIGIISAIYNEPGCATDCHFHPEDKKVLGALDVVVRLEEIDKEVALFQRWISGLALFVFLIMSTIIFIFVLKFVKGPITKLIEGTRRISDGDYRHPIAVESGDEVGHLAQVINHMAGEIDRKQTELNRQKDIYQSLFEMVPCIITVQDRDYKLLQYNREFNDKFAPTIGDFCYRVYKGREEKCTICPVERTFKDGKSHTSEERGIGKDGQPTYWLVKTAAVRNEEGEIVAAMEMNLDITKRKLLEDELEKSEKKYHAIFNNIPNPVFVLEEKSLKILDCNDSVAAIYDLDRETILNRSFMDFFPETDRDKMAGRIKNASVLNQVKQLKESGQALFVNIRISPSEYPGQKVLLVTTSDITKRLETEQQLIQASKMATLGEMATGVAHELNQPLTVIKTASSFFMKKINKKEPIPENILLTMASEIDSHVDRATKIINHMRQFGRISDIKLEPVQVNTVLEKTFEIFSQQLKVRGIEVFWNLEESLPVVMADPDRLEQVFINLLINARDAIMDKLESTYQDDASKKIFLNTRSEADTVSIEVCDTGLGVPPGIIDKIFEPFFTTKEVGKGTGLGLSISYGIIKDFGGRIQAAKNEPEGTCFVIRLPANHSEK